MIKETEVKEYWAERAAKFKEAAVGFDSHKNTHKQNMEYQERKKFIFSHINPKHGMVLDYGCGVGRYANDFTNYVGVDMTEGLLNIAKENNPRKLFFLLEKPYITTNVARKLRLNKQPITKVFTATVLQHCSAALVLKIFRSIYEFIGSKGIEFYLYEKDNDDLKPHVVSRLGRQYLEILYSAGFRVTCVEHHSHTVHKEKHSLHIIQT